MKRSLILVFAAAAALLALVGVTAASAKDRGTRFEFTGTVMSAPGPNATSLSIAILGGNRAALLKLIGQSQNQTFAVDSHTQYLIWSHGTPKVGSSIDVQTNDVVTLTVRADSGAGLSDVEKQAAGRVSDRGQNPDRPDRPLFLFRGKLASAGGGKVAIHVTSGNWRGLQAMLGQSLDQAFAYDSGTVFLLWQGRVPTVIAAEQLKAGDEISVRVRAPRGSSLAQVEAVPATRVAEHEPGSPETQS